MLGIQLPSSSIPDWARSVTDDQLHQTVAHKLARTSQQEVGGHTTSQPQEVVRHLTSESQEVTSSKTDIGDT